MKTYIIFYRILDPKAANTFDREMEVVAENKEEAVECFREKALDLYGYYKNNITILGIYRSIKYKGRVC